MVKNFRQLLSLVPRRTLALALLVTVVTSASANAVPVLLGRLVNAMQVSQQRGTVAAEWPGLALFYLGVILAVFLAREGLQLLRKFLARQVGTRVEKELTLAVVERLLRADLGLFAASKLGTLQARVKHGVGAGVQLLKLGLQDLVPAVLTVACALAYVLYIHPPAGLLLLVALPVMLLLATWRRRAQAQDRLAVQRAEEALSGALVEQMSGIEYLRAANRHDREVERVAHVAEERQRSAFSQQFRAALFDAAAALNEWFFQIGILGCALLFTFSAQAPFGTTLTLWYVYFNILHALKDLFAKLDQAHEGKSRLDDVQALLQEPADRSFAPVVGNDGASLSLAHRRPLLVTRDVVVEYRTPAGATRRALDGVTLEIKTGEVVGIAGASGSGKSTLVKLLLRLVHPSAGQVSLAGTPLEAVSREALARLVAYVGQEPFLFSGTVAENIAYGTAGACHADIVRAAELVGLHDEIVRSPGGYEAAVGERGRNLSGGQRQRLALARALLQDAPVLVLDEATSALDSANEQRVLRAVLAGRPGRTVLLVAHRPAALQAADRVLTFDAGRLVTASRSGGR
jgi:ATP-binding cassette subfamily B protein